MMAGSACPWSPRGVAPIHPRLTSPTCKDVGIPTDVPLGVMTPPPSDHDDQCFRLNDLVYDHSNPNNPFSPYSRIPLPSPFGEFECNGVEPAFIRKRNERERDRVRCVNEGYARLRQHLPFERKDKRVSKVETLRAAIRYIRHLQALLDQRDAAAGSSNDSADTGDEDEDSS
jgi:achaete-scute complex protein